MPKRVIEIPDELNEGGDVFEAVLANVRRTVARTGGGKAVDYAQVEAAVSDDGARVERATHRAILQSLDVDVPAIIIGGALPPGRPMPGAVPHTGGLGVDRAIAVPAIRDAWRHARGKGGGHGRGDTGNRDSLEAVS